MPSPISTPHYIKSQTPLHISLLKTPFELLTFLREHLHPLIVTLRIVHITQITTRHLNSIPTQLELNIDGVGAGLHRRLLLISPLSTPLYNHHEEHVWRKGRSEVLTTSSAG